LDPDPLVSGTAPKCHGSPTLILQYSIVWTAWDINGILIIDVGFGSRSILTQVFRDKKLFTLEK
jgi:hypothetical protein